MGIFAYFSSGTKATDTVANPKPDATVIDVKTEPIVENVHPSEGIAASDSSSSNASQEQPERPPIMAASTPNLNRVASVDAPTKKRRLSFRPFTTHSQHNEHVLTAVQEHDKKVKASAALSHRLAAPLTVTSDKRAKESALILRSLILGPTAASPKVTVAVANPQMNKIKSQLLQPKSANKVIAQLRTLSVPSAEGEHLSTGNSSGLIHAVCLEHTDAEEHELHFSKFERSAPSPTQSFLKISSVPVEELAGIFSEMRLVSLLEAPDFGFGQPGDGDGILAGAVPTAETVIKGIQQVTPQLLALGYATGKAVIPDHTGIYPPTDRMSVLTYWWGLEIVLPPRSLLYLKNAHSISDAIMNFLSALSLINNGVREILPFIRYISQFIDFEFSAIEAQNKGKGVVCAATWIMPAAMVPRPWDFAPAPSKDAQDKNGIPPTSDHAAEDSPNTPSATSVPIVPSPMPHPMTPMSNNVTITVTSPSPSVETIPSQASPPTPPTPSEVVIAAAA